MSCRDLVVAVTLIARLTLVDGAMYPHGGGNCLDLNRVAASTPTWRQVDAEVTSGPLGTQDTVGAQGRWALLLESYTSMLICSVPH